MNIRFYCDLYISDRWKNKKRQILERIRKNRILPDTYIVALSRGEQNHLEFYQGILLRQRIFGDEDIFVTGIADGYGEALQAVLAVTEETYRRTGGADLRSYIQSRQEEFEKTGR